MENGSGAPGIRARHGGTMTLGEYRTLALRTEKSSPLSVPFDVTRLLHGAIGIAGESGELLDQIKRHLFYGLPLDRTNVLEECGDLLWYLNLALCSLGFSFEDAMRANIAKLERRYPGGEFTQERAEKRDLSVERIALEGAHDE